MDEMIPETDVDNNQCYEQIVDIRPLKLFRVQTKGRLTINSRERQPKKRCQTCVKHERESTCLSLGVPADHEARSQVRRSAAKVKALREGLTQKRDRAQQNSKAWGRPRAMQERSVKNKTHGHS